MKISSKHSNSSCCGLWMLRSVAAAVGVGERWQVTGVTWSITHDIYFFFYIWEVSGSVAACHRLHSLGITKLPQASGWSCMECWSVDRWQVIRDTWHMTCDMWQVKGVTRHVNFLLALLSFQLVPVLLCDMSRNVVVFCMQEFFFNVYTITYQQLVWTRYGFFLKVSWHNQSRAPTAFLSMFI